MGELRVMSPADGDYKTRWDPESDEEVAAARKVFDDLKAKGYQGFHVDKKGEATKRMRIFDPEAGAIIMTAPLKGG